MQWWLQVIVRDKCRISCCCWCCHFTAEVSLLMKSSYLSFVGTINGALCALRGPDHLLLSSVYKQFPYFFPHLLASLFIYLLI